MFKMKNSFASYYDILLLCLAPYVSHFLSLYPVVCFIFVFLRLFSSSHLLLLYSQEVRIFFIVGVLSCVISILSHLGIPLFFYSISILFVPGSSYFSGGIFLVVLSYPVR